MFAVKKCIAVRLKFNRVMCFVLKRVLDYFLKKSVHLVKFAKPKLNNQKIEDESEFTVHGVVPIKAGKVQLTNWKPMFHVIDIK